MELAFDHHAVLLADDSPDDTMLMRKAWRNAGLENPLIVVHDGEQALAYLNGHGPYGDRDKFPFPIAMFLDLKLPRVDGLDVLRAIRDVPDLRSLSVEVLSASARANDVEKALELGANSYLVKPSRFEALVGMLRAWQTLARGRMFAIPSMGGSIAPNG